MFLASLDWMFLVPLAVFGAFAAGAWWVMEWLAARKPRATERLEELRTGRARNQPQVVRTNRRAAEAVAKVLEKASPALSRPLQPKSEKEVGLVRQRLSYAGFRRDSAPTVFYSTKLVGLIGGLLMAGGFALLSENRELGKLMRLSALAGICFYVPDVIVWWKSRKRREAIFLGLPDALDLMVVCVESGLGLDQAMRKVADEMKKSHRVIAEEFAICNFQLQMGRERKGVLKDLGGRNGVDDLRSLASVLIQADKFGSSVGQALRVQSDAMRTRRRQIAEEKAAKTAVQLIFPLVLFIFPGIFVVLVGPAAITMIREMFPMMSGN
jgi:tight adherence protein C